MGGGGGWEGYWYVDEIGKLIPACVRKAVDHMILEVSGRRSGCDGRGRRGEGIGMWRRCGSLLQHAVGKAVDLKILG